MIKHCRMSDEVDRDCLGDCGGSGVEVPRLRLLGGGNARKRKVKAVAKGIVTRGMEIEGVSGAERSRVTTLW